MAAIVFYFHVHQPLRVKPYGLFSIGDDAQYFNSTEDRLNNRKILRKVSEKCYLPAYQLVPLARITAEITQTLDNQQFQFDTYLYHVTLKPDQIIHPASDLDSLVHISSDELKDLIKRLRSLSSALISVGDESKGQFRWSDWGNFYSQIHHIGLELTTHH